MKAHNSSLLLLPYSGASLGRVVATCLTFSVFLCLVTSVSARGNSSVDIAIDGAKGDDQNHQDRSIQEFGLERPCPEAEDIAPCYCYYDDDLNQIDLVCSEIESEEQLRLVFEAYIPFKKFGTFYMYFNTNLKVLESNVFGDVSFETIDIRYSKLERIENDAFSSCYDTATDLHLHDNNINYFPFDNMINFTKLNHFYASGNYLNPFPLDSFHGLTNLHGFYLFDNHGTFTGNFQNIPSLFEIHVLDNNLSTIPANFFKTGSNNISDIYIYECQVMTVEPGAFDIDDGLWINLNYNLLSTLDEATWRPLFEGGVKLYVDYNPLNCGCDIAWLYGEDHLLTQVDHKATCRDGTRLHDLDPKIFDLC